ncbi:hypothetical protein BCA37_25395 [Mycobacterium sp. djl-10]|nr:hypothetical protein BCA37_25395 [Mycobacterium sp. djl-10]
MIMVENQTPDYVMNAIATLHNEGYTFDQSVTLMNHAVNTTCPSIKPLVAETLAQYSQGVLGP